MRYIYPAIAFIILFSCCKKSTSSTSADVEIYLLKSFDLVTGECRVNPLTAVLEEAPIVLNSDILQYSSSTYMYTVTGNAIQKLQSLTPRTPFALTLDKQVVYLGITMRSTMSSSCAHSIVLIDNLVPTGKFQMRLGYPGVATGTSVDDKRNNPKLLAELSRQGKLR